MSSFIVQASNSFSCAEEFVFIYFKEPFVKIFFLKNGKEIVSKTYSKDTFLINPKNV